MNDHGILLSTTEGKNSVKLLVKIKPNHQFQLFLLKHLGVIPGGVLPYMGYIGMCRCEGYGFQAVYSRIGYINQNVWV